MKIQKLHELVKTMSNRKRSTKMAINEVKKLVKELEMPLAKNISTKATTKKIKILAFELKESNNMETYNLKADSEFSLCIKSGKIQVKDLFRPINEDDYFYDDQIIVYGREFLNNEIEYERIDFKMLVETLEELFKMVEEVESYLESDAIRFLDFCKSWQNVDSQ